MKRSSFAILSVILDALLANAGFILAFLIRFSGTLPAYNFNAYLILIPVITAAFIVCCWMNDLYDPSTFLDVLTIARKVLVSTTIATIAIMAAAFLGGEATAPLARLSLIIAWVLVTFLFIVWRYLFMRFGSIRWPRQNVLIVGCSSTTTDLLAEISNRTHRGWRCVGIVSDSANATEAASDLLGSGSSTPDVPHAVQRPDSPPVLGTTSDIAAIIKSMDLDRIIVASDAARETVISNLVLYPTKDIAIDVVPDLYEIFFGQFDSTLGDIPLTHVARTSRPAYFEIAKRAFDILFSALGLVLASPVMLVAFLMVKSQDGGPFLYRQDRVGKDGVVFKLFKIRTMRPDAEKDLGPVLASYDDPRITSVGARLRRLRIDEVPQLMNILAGDMSFVGPRPERPFFVEKHLREIPAYAERFTIKPGVTGLAQISGGYATDPERKLKYDLIYLYHRGVGLDLRILASTFKVVFTGRGAR